MAAHQPEILIIEGEIGAGKTELAKALAAELSSHGKKVCLVFEPVAQWNAVGILQLFYQNMARYAYSFQTFAFATRVLAIRAGVLAMPDADVMILERSPATDAVFMELQRDNLSPAEMEMYSAWCGAWQDLLPLDLGRARVLYLKTSLGACMARVAIRGRDGEAGVTGDYQARLRRAFEAFLEGADRAEFSHLVGRSPFAPGKVFTIGPEIADRDFRGGRDPAALAEILRVVGI